MDKKKNNFYTKILNKLDKLGHLEAIKYYMQIKDKELGFFACQVIVEDWFEGERGEF